MSDESTGPEQSVAPRPHGRLQFAFPHSKRGEWWLTDGYGYSHKVNRVVWLYYRATRHWRWQRFMEERA